MCVFVCQSSFQSEIPPIYIQYNNTTILLCYFITLQYSIYIGYYLGTLQDMDSQIIQRFKDSKIQRFKDSKIIHRFIEFITVSQLGILCIFRCLVFFTRRFIASMFEYVCYIPFVTFVSFIAFFVIYLRCLVLLFVVLQCMLLLGVLYRGLHI